MFNCLSPMPGFGGGFTWPGQGQPCSCCPKAGSACWPHTADEDEETITETITQPCCIGGSCYQCGAIGGDAPWLMPKAIGCGRTHKCNLPWKFPLYDEQLDNHELPGRPPHTIVCVRAKGKTTAEVIPELMVTEGIDDPCMAYDLYLCVTVPVEIIIRDCMGQLFCLTSKMSQIVRIPLATRVKNLKETQIYLKARIRLCKTVHVEYPNTDDKGINREATECIDPADYDPLDATGTADDIEKNLNCNQAICFEDGLGSYTDDDGNVIHRALPAVMLDFLIEACVMRLVPYGVLGDPNCKF